jgi:G:T-mismatch repair DNA endonuclease (very short patch repair protein)
MATIERDNRALEAIAGAGWQSYVVWECAVKEENILLSNLREFLGELHKSQKG